ncbi:hypothetical protein GGR54DRAFT_74841 [Hypoxylon sp. NC1633]|nr:hypothetical protein GGR54DRAFT_74841 [Hypoxylon sp. NC1633]
MAGRRRRAPSNSTVATIDQAAIQFYREDSILKPAPTQAHTDDWPCFLLTDATVYKRDGTLASLLHVDLEGPFIVRGRVEIERDQDRYLVNRHIRDRSPWIQIQNTLSFSIGLKEDGLPMPVLWASGHAGWYEIVPSQTYKPMCDVMFQGISLHYAILDEYEAALENLHKKKKNRQKMLHDVTLPLHQVLFKYAVTVGDGITLQEANQQIKDQAIFLLSHFPKDTQFYDWLANEFSDIAQKLAAKANNESNKKAAVSAPSSLVAVPYSFLEQSTSADTTPVIKGKNSLRKSASRMTRSSEVLDAEMVEPSFEQSQEEKAARTRLKSLANSRSDSTHSHDMTMLDVPDRRHSTNAAHNSGKGGSSLRMTIEKNLPQPMPQDAGRVGARIHSGRSSSVSQVIDVLEDARQEMVDLVSNGKQKKHPDEMSPKTWLNKLYLGLSIKNPKALAEVCGYYARDLVQLLGPEWHGSLFYQWVKDNVNANPSFEYIDEENMTRIVKRKKKQRLSPEEARATAGEQEPAARTVGKQPPQRGRPRVAGLRPSTGSKKRLHYDANLEDEMDIDEDGMPNTSKRSRNFAEDEQEENADNSSSVSDDEDIENKQLPLYRIVTHAEKLPSTIPKGPNQTWTCEEPDCDYVVRAADEQEGQALISKHFEAHEKDAQEEAEQTSLVNLAVQESEKGHVPINHLLEKIRKLGDKSQKREEVRLNGQVLPQPIKRGLLV